MKLTLTATVVKTAIEKTNKGIVKKSTVQFDSGQTTSVFDDFTVAQELPLGAKLSVVVESIDEVA